MLAGRSLLVTLAVGCGRLEFSAVTVDAADAPGPACPQGFVGVRGSVALGTADFCVMQFEARRANSTASVGPQGTPWVDITATAARAACQAMGPSFDLISNPEWMTIARDAEGVGVNWSGGAPGAGRIVEGQTDGSPDLNPGVTDASDPYSDTGNSAADPPGGGWEQRRTVVLSTGGVVWDLAGNVQEWIDWRTGGALDGAPPCAGGELPALACAGYANDDYNSAAGTYDSSIGVGLVIGGAGNAARRSGQNGDRPPGYAGIYALNMNRFVDDTFPATSFRCVLRNIGARRAGG